MTAALSLARAGRGGNLCARVLFAVALILGQNLRVALGELVPAEALPLRTQGRYIVGKDGQRVRLFCVNWYGAHMTQMVNNGLNRRPLSAIAEMIAELGFNCVRLPYSLSLLERNDPEDFSYRRWWWNHSLKANPELRNSTALEVFDATVAGLSEVGLLVILNNHVSEGGWCCSGDDGEGFWYTAEYPEGDWLNALTFVAARYRDDPRVVGIDLRNEVRDRARWGGGDRATDWADAAVKGSKRVLAESPDWLVIVSGLHYSMFLCDVPRRPIHVDEPGLQGRVVYTAHEYPWFNAHTVVRGLLEMYMICITTVVLLFSCVFVLCRRRCRACMRSRKCGPTRVCRCRGHQPGVKGAVFAFFLTVGALVLVALSMHYSTRCGSHADWMAVGFPCLAASLGAWSLLLWLRLVWLLVSRAFGEDPEKTREVAGGAGEVSPTETSPSETSKSVLPVGNTILRKPTLLAASRGARGELLMIGGILLLNLLTSMIAWHLLGSYEGFESELNGRWGYLLHGEGGDVAGFGAVPLAPVWLGEFGADEDTLWWRHLMRYSQENSLDWAYWSFNGEKWAGQDETYGLVEQDHVRIRHRWKLRALETLMAAA